MSGVKHTGWKADCGFHRHDPKMTCSVRITSGTIQVKTEDEARLIAAAPDLLEALSRAVHSYDGVPPRHRPAWFDEAQAAIARARGEQDGGGHV